MKTVLIFIGSLSLLLILMWVLFTYVLISDEDRIHRLILKCKEGIESGSVLSISSVFAADYSDESGMDKTLALQTIRTLSQATTSRTIQILSIEINIQDETAFTALECRMDAEPNPNAANLSFLSHLQSRRLHVQLEWTKIKGNWKLQYSEINAAR